MGQNLHLVPPCCWWKSHSIPPSQFDINAKTLLRWGSPENPMKFAYLVAQGYANFCKMVSMVIIHVTRFRITPQILNLGTSHCHPYQFLEICIPLCNAPIGLIQKGHLNDICYRWLEASPKCCMKLLTWNWKKSYKTHPPPWGEKITWPLLKFTRPRCHVNNDHSLIERCGDYLPVYHNHSVP